MYTIRRLRSDLGLTQGGLAEKLNCTKGSIVKIENGQTSETLEKRIKSYLMLECAEYKTAKINVLLSDVKEVVTVTPKLSPCGGFYSFEFHTAFGVALIKHDVVENQFYVTHKPISVDKESLARETRRASEIVKILNYSSELK